MRNATCEPLTILDFAHQKEQIGCWGEEGEQPHNATLPPYGGEYVELQPHLCGWRNSTRQVPVVFDRLDKTSPPERKSGAEPGWLPDDELTHEWLKYMEQYRSECDAADRKRILDAEG